MPDALAKLAALLDRELAAGRTLLAALEAERVALAGPDATALDGAVATKEGRLADFTALEAERHAAVAALGHAADRAGMTACLRAYEDPRYADDAPAAGPVATRWRALLELVARLRDANERNGRIVALRSRRVREALNVLRTGRPDPLTYGPAPLGAPATRAIARA